MAQEAANQWVSKLEAALRAMGDYDGPEVATLKSSLQKARAASRSKPIQDQIEETEVFISRAQKRLSVVREQELLDKALLRKERLRRELQIELEELPCAVPDVSTAPKVGSHCRRTQEGTRRFAAESGGSKRRVDGERTSRCGPSATHSCSGAAHIRLAEFQELRTSQRLGVWRSQHHLQVVFFISWHHRVHGHQFKIRFDGCFDHGWRRKAPLPSWEGCSSFHDWKPSELRESGVDCGSAGRRGIASRLRPDPPREAVAEHVGG